jgi:hypothetical protein
MHARRCRAIDTRMHMNPSIRACARRWLQPNADGAADARVRVCASGHPYTPRCTSVDTDARCTDGHNTHPRARTRTRTRSRRHGFYICTHTYTYVLTHTHIYVSLVVARVRAAPDARSHAHTHTHIRADMYSIYALLHIHMGSVVPTYICT